MAATGDDRIKAATFLTTQMDFVDAGDLKVFIDDEQLQAIETEMAERGYLDGASMGGVFNMLRSNDLIWSYVVNNYLMGKDPFPFDLLFWNADTTRMPAAMHSFYLREFYQYNSFAKGKLKLKGVTLDPAAIQTPIYNLGTREDHIAPIKSVAKIGSLVGGPVRLVVAGSGHIAGVVNPPAKEKYQYWTSDKPVDDIDIWLDQAKETPGSWWPDWAAWARGFAGGKVPARAPGARKLKVIEPAPGAYVKQRTGGRRA
jgi:polyhydroxyalkanoate synthase